jgi:hypothetical protein
MIMSHTVVFPDAVPPDTPITKGCLAVGGEAAVVAAAAAEEASAVPLQVAVEGEDGRDEEEERRRESRRSPLKWAPTADSSTSSIVAGVLSWRSVFGEVGGFDTGMGRVLGGGGGGEEQKRLRLRGAGLRTPVR